MHIVEFLKGINKKLDAGVAVSLYGTIEGLLADRPNPGTVPIGTRYWAVDTGEYAVSTGTTWRVLGVV